MAYIDRDKLIDKLEELQFNAPVMTPVMKIYNVIELVEDQPNEDVVEVKHSQWVVEAYDNQDNIVVIPYIEHQHCEPFCLICGKRALLNGAEDYVTSNYCPNCGAKMDLVGD